jgi:hypothetical protein
MQCFSSRGYAIYLHRFILRAEELKLYTEPVGLCLPPRLPEPKPRDEFEGRARERCGADPGFHVIAVAQFPGCRRSRSLTSGL